MGEHVLRYRYKKARKDAPEAEVIQHTAMALNRQVIGDVWTAVLQWLMTKRSVTRITGPAPRGPLEREVSKLVGEMQK